MNLLLISFEGLALRTIQHSKTSDDIFTDILLLLFVGRERVLNINNIRREEGETLLTTNNTRPGEASKVDS